MATASGPVFNGNSVATSSVHQCLLPALQKPHEEGSVVIMLFYEWENAPVAHGVQRQEGSPGMGISWRWVRETGMLMHCGSVLEKSSS